MEEFLTFIREYPVLVLGIMALGAVWVLIVDRDLTLMCSDDGSPMDKVQENEWECPKCGTLKRV